MPPKKGQAKKKRVPHANETPLKDKQPGHGAVERAKNQNVVIILIIIIISTNNIIDGLGGSAGTVSSS